eukprot:Sdes_comp18320_c0_seq1m8041
MTHYSVRVFAQAALFLVWKKCDFHLSLMDPSQSFITSFPYLSEFFNSLESHSDNIKHREKALKDYFFGVMNPLTDYCLETIFTTIPTICGIESHEIIPLELMKSVLGNHPSSFIPLQRHFHGTGPGPCEGDYVNSRAKLKESSAFEKESLSPDSKSPMTVQKKIDPWQGVIGVDSELLNMMDTNSRSGSVSNTRFPLILMASLLEKSANLGGLCRTCEIFHIGSMTMNSLSIRQDSTFQSLAVTSHLWMPLVEVKQYNIENFLSEQKKLGYRLVAAEQTCDSFCLTDYSFDEKTVLILGEEKKEIGR